MECEHSRKKCTDFHYQSIRFKGQQSTPPMEKKIGAQIPNLKLIAIAILWDYQRWGKSCKWVSGIKYKINVGWVEV